jgi:hypothetical protein
MVEVEDSRKAPNVRIQMKGRRRRETGREERERN